MQSFRAVYDDTAAEMAVRVMGFHHDIGHRTGGGQGVDDWFCFVFHDAVPVLTVDGVVEAAPGNVMVNGPGELVQQGREGSWRRSWLRFASSRAGLLLTQSGLQTRRLYAVDDPALHDRWLLAMRAELEHPAGADPRTLHDLLACWWRSIARAARGAASVPAPVLTARRLIEERYLEPLSLDGIAQAVGLSRTHLCRGFSAAFQTTPMHYVQRLRLQHAADLLQGSDLTVTAIAAASGFSDVYYFSRAFKKDRGQTPSAYRRGAGG